jgi:hypothetical protein
MPYARTDHRPDRMVRYHGVADWWGRHIWVDRDGVRSSLPAWGEDPGVAYAWGRAGIGTRELARALLRDVTGSPAVAERYCREFTHQVLTQLPETEFALEREQILHWLARQPPVRLTSR